MLSQASVAEIERLLAAGKLSQRAIARLTGISRATISAVALGRRPNYELLRKQRQDRLEIPRGPKARCGGCGGMVYMPCWLCHVRRIKDAERSAVRAARQQARARAARQLALDCHAHYLASVAKSAQRKAG